jgi:hypothetical protein
VARQRRRGKGEGTIYKVGPNRWQAQITIRDEFGRSRRPTLYGKTRAEVQEKRDEALRKIREGTYCDTTVTLGQHLDEWLQEKKRSVKASTFQQYEYCVADHIKPRLGKFRLKEVTARQVQTMVHDIADRNRGGRTRAKQGAQQGGRGHPEIRRIQQAQRSEHGQQVQGAPQPSVQTRDQEADHFSKPR